MTTVCVLKNWDWPDLKRQTPKNSGFWDGIKFVFEPVDYCDYLVFLNYGSSRVSIVCPQEHVWTIMQEPPNEYYAFIHRGNPSVHRVFTSHPGLKTSRYVHTQPALPWHINLDYDTLRDIQIPEKERLISCVTSDEAVFQGQRERIKFIESLQGFLPFDLWGRGYHFINDKWDGLAPYRYSLAIENYQNKYYWSEKLADCFLTWTMPIYFGCTDITKYFPAESMLIIDINDPSTVERIQEAIMMDRWRRNLDAIAEARRRVLERYQLFPFLKKQIEANENRVDFVQPQMKRINISAGLPWYINLPAKINHWCTQKRNIDYGH